MFYGFDDELLCRGDGGGRFSGGMDLDSLLMDLDTGYGGSPPLSPSSRGLGKRRPSTVASNSSASTQAISFKDGGGSLTSSCSSPLHRFVTPPANGADDDDLLLELLPGFAQPCCEDADPRRGLDPRCRRALKREDPTPSPRSDNRGCVNDDYDVVAAIADFSERQNGRVESPRLTTISQLHSQAAQLMVAMSNRRGTMPAEVLSHYSRRRQDFLDEARALQSKDAFEASSGSSCEQQASC